LKQDNSRSFNPIAFRFSGNLHIVKIQGMNLNQTCTPLFSTFMIFFSGTPKPNFWKKKFCFNTFRKKRSNKLFRGLSSRYFPYKESLKILRQSDQNFLSYPFFRFRADFDENRPGRADFGGGEKIFSISFIFEFVLKICKKN